MPEFVEEPTNPETLPPKEPQAQTSQVSYLIS